MHRIRLDIGKDPRFRGRLDIISVLHSGTTMALGRQNSMVLGSKEGRHCQEPRFLLGGFLKGGSTEFSGAGSDSGLAD